MKIYDIRITNKGFFNMLGRKEHVPGILEDITETDLDIIAGAGWEYEIIRVVSGSGDDDDPTNPDNLIYPFGVRQVLLDDMTKLDLVRDFKRGDRVVDMSSGDEFVVDI